MLLLIDVTPLRAVFVFIVTVIAMMLFAAATQNWFLTKSRIWESLALLLIAFTLFRPGFWLDQWQAPYDLKPPAEIIQLANDAADGEALRVRVLGEDLSSGKEIDTTVALPLGNKADGDGAERLNKNAGIEFRVEDDKVYVDNVSFGKMAQKKGIDLDWELTRIEMPAERTPKEVFYIPALLLLGLIMWLQLRRREPEPSYQAA